MSFFSTTYMIFHIHRYGDVSPQLPITRLIAVFYVPFTCSVTTKILGQFSGVYMKRKTKANEENFMDRKLTLKDLREMDVTGNGQVSYDEFLTFMLVRMGKVEKEDLIAIENLYHRLDRDNNNQLNVHDLYLAAYGSNDENENENEVL